MPLDHWKSNNFTHILQITSLEYQSIMLMSVQTMPVYYIILIAMITNKSPAFYEIYQHAYFVGKRFIVPLNKT